MRANPEPDDLGAATLTKCPVADADSHGIDIIQGLDFLEV